MRRFHLLAGALALAFALAAVGGAAARSQATTLHIAASMVAANEISVCAPEQIRSVSRICRARKTAMVSFQLAVIGC